MWYLMVPVFAVTWRTGLVVATDRFLADNLTMPTRLVGIVLVPAERENWDCSQGAR